MEGEMKHVIKYWMGGEISNFIKVWLSVYASLCYCYLAAKAIPRGTKRLLAFLPVVSLFLLLPLNLHSMHLGGITSFFVAWLANFKLLMYAFHKGPLSHPSISSLLHFVAIGCLPIQIQPNKTPSQIAHKSIMNYAVKGLLMALFLKVYDYSEYIHPKIILFIYGFHIYFCLELMLAMAAALARVLLGVELDPQFNEPLLSSSLQDFWGRRWNLMVTRILRPAVYNPALNYLSFLGQTWAKLFAIMATFVVSAVMHELIFYYLGRMKPTWEITWFFLLHGVCLMVEVAAKKALRDRVYVPRIISIFLTVAFVTITGFWLFFPQLLRCKADVIGIQEYAAVGAFVKDLTMAALSSSTSLTTSNSTKIAIGSGI